MSMPIEPANVPVLERMLSAERLEKLTKLSGSSVVALELHQESLRVGASLMHTIGTIEIALRNVVCENLTSYFGVPNWLTQTPVAFKWREPERNKIQAAVDSAQRAEYAKLTQAEKSDLDRKAYPKGRPSSKTHLQRARDRRRTIQLSEGKVVAELTFYFWKRLFGPEYEQTLWRTSLKRTFPWKKLKRAEVAIQLEKIYQARNRLAHHEPVLNKRFSETVEAIQFVTSHLDAAVPSRQTPLANLLESDLEAVNSRAQKLHARLESFRIEPAPERS